MDIEIVIDGKKLSLQEARELYGELHKLFRERQPATPFQPWQPINDRDKPFKLPEPLKIWSSGSISGDPNREPLSVTFQ